MAAVSVPLTSPGPVAFCRAIEDSHYKFLRTVAGRPVERTGPEELIWYLSDLPHPLLNGVAASGACSSDEFPDTARALEGEGVPASFWLPDRLTDAGTLDRLVEQGMTRAERWVGLAVDLRAAAQHVDPPPAFLVQESLDLSGDRLFARTWNQAALGLPEAAEAAVAERIEAARAVGLVRPFLAWSRGAPAAVFFLSPGEWFAGVHGIATMAVARRQGIAAAMVLHALRIAAEDGTRFAVSTGPPETARVLERLGFLEYFRWERLEWFPANAL